MSDYLGGVINGINDKTEEAFKYLYNTFYASLCRYANRFVGDNACLVYIRDQKEKRQEELIQHLGEVMTFDSTDNEQLLIEEEYYRQIFTVLNSLSDQRRVIVEMTMKGMRNEEIAQSLHVSVNTVKTLKKKAYVYLRENLSREGWMFLFTFL